MRTEPVGDCPLCGSTDRARWFGDLADPRRVAPGRWSLHRCAGCGCAVLDPRPVSTDLPVAYQGYFTHQAPALPATPCGVPAVARRALRDGYLARRYGYDLPAARSPAGRLGPWVVPLLPRQRALADRTVRHLPAGRRLLDVGCGNGDFLAVAASLGWQAEGVDVDAEAVAAAVAAGLTARHGTVADVAADGGREAYDAVTLSHVVEHVPDPVGLLASARLVLRSGGTLWVATPSLDATGLRRWGADWVGLDPPRHLVLFTASGLLRAVRSAGYRDARLAPAAPLASLQWHMSLPAGAGARLPPAWAVRARLADAVARRRPERGEELCVVATA